MLIQLPIEVWMEILDFLHGHRRELAAKFDQFGDYTFSEFYQHWLHKYTKNVRLGLLTIEQEIVFNKDGKEESNALLKVCFPLVVHQPPKRVINDRDHRRVKVPLADVPMPENIKGCKELQISYLDSGVLNFLRLMMPAFVSSSTALHIIMTDTGSRLDDTALNEEDYTRMRTALRHLLPLFINASFSDFSFHSRTSSIFSFILHHCPQQLFSAKLIRFSDATHTIVQSIVRWLCTKQTDAEPRIAIFYGLNSLQLFEAICEAIREQFLGAVSPVSFYTRITVLAGFRVPTHFPESSHKNEATGEQLIVRQHPNKHNYCLIGRFSSANVVDGDLWLRKMGERTNQIQNKNHLLKIKLFQPSIGPLESTAAGEDEEGSSAAMVPTKNRRQEQQGEEKEGIDQPGPSKKHRN